MTWIRRAPLTREDLRLIRIRARDRTPVLAVQDRRDLLAEIDRLRSKETPCTPPTATSTSGS